MKERPNTKVQTADGILAKIASDLAATLHIEAFKLKMLIDEFVRKMNLANTITHHTKANLFNDFTKNKMTIKTFIRFLYVIKIKKAVFTVKIITHNGIEKEVSQTVDITHESFSMKEEDNV